MFTKIFLFLILIIVLTLQCLMEPSSLAAKQGSTGNSITSSEPSSNTVISKTFKSTSFKISHNILLEARDFSYPHIRSDNPNAVTIVGFFDFADSKCVSMYKVIDKIARSRRVNYIFRDFSSDKSLSLVPAAAVKAYIINFSKYLDFRNALIELWPNYSEEEINKVAINLSLVSNRKELNKRAKNFDLNSIFADFEEFNNKNGNQIGFKAERMLDTERLVEKLNIGINKENSEAVINNLPVFIIEDNVISGEYTEAQVLDLIKKEEDKKSINNTFTKLVHPKITENYSVDKDSNLIIKKYKEELFFSPYDDFYSKIPSNSEEAVPVISFCDFSEAKCQYMLPIVQKITASTKVNLVFRELLFNVKNVEEATYNPNNIVLNPFFIKSLSLPKEELYFKTLPTLFKIVQENPWVNTENIEGILAEQEILLYLVKLLMGYNSELKSSLAATWEVAQKINATDTPTFIIGDRFIVRGVISYKNFMELVNEALSLSNPNAVSK